MKSPVFSAINWVLIESSPPSSQASPWTQDPPEVSGFAGAQLD